MTDEHITDICQELTDCENLIREASAEYRKLVRSAACTRFDYDLAWAGAILEIKTSCDESGQKMTVVEKEALAVQQVQGEMQKCRIAEAESDASKKHLDSVLGILSSIQTRARLIKTEASLNQYN